MVVNKTGVLLQNSKVEYQVQLLFKLASFDYAVCTFAQYTYQDQHPRVYGAPLFAGALDFSLESTTTRYRTRLLDQLMSVLSVLQGTKIYDGLCTTNLQPTNKGRFLVGGWLLSLIQGV